MVNKRDITAVLARLARPLLYAAAVALAVLVSLQVVVGARWLLGPSGPSRVPARPGLRLPVPMSGPRPERALSLPSFDRVLSFSLKLLGVVVLIAAAVLAADMLALDRIPGVDPPLAGLVEPPHTPEAVQPYQTPIPPSMRAELQATEAAALNGYEWIDREAGVVRLPIDRAIEWLAGQGLPARSETPGAAGVESPSDASSGR